MRKQPAKKAGPLKLVEQEGRTLADGRRRGVVEGLLTNGDPDPLCIPRNIHIHGYSCPREEFVRSPQVPHLNGLMKKWNCPADIIGRWRLEQKWDKMRTDYWMGRAASAHDLTAEAIANTQISELSQRLGYWQEIRDNALAQLHRGVIEKPSPLGGAETMAMDAATLKNLASTIRDAEKAINELLGFNLGLLKAGSGDMSEVQTVKEVVVRVHKRVTEDESPELTTGAQGRELVQSHLGIPKSLPEPDEEETEDEEVDEDGEDEEFDD